MLTKPIGPRNPEFVILSLLLGQTKSRVFLSEQASTDCPDNADAAQVLLWINLQWKVLLSSCCVKMGKGNKVKE